MYVWVGKRESDIHFSKNEFHYSITLWGNNRKGNKALSVSYPNIIYGSKEYIRLLSREMRVLLAYNSNMNFLFYNSSHANTIFMEDQELGKHIIIASNWNFDWLRQKVFFRLWASNYCSIPPSTIITENECQYKILTSLFPTCNQFIVQANISSGGEKTYEITPNCTSLSTLQKGQTYLVSPYLQGWNSFNAHVMISRSRVFFLSLSLQLIKKNHGKFIYVGGDFSSSRITKKIFLEIRKASISLAEILQKNGYRGIIGFDFLANEDNVVAIESNPRFQGSSILVDKALHERYGLSLFGLHINCCEENALGEYDSIDLSHIGSCLYLTDLTKPILQQHLIGIDALPENSSVGLTQSSVYDIVTRNMPGYFV